MTTEPDARAWTVEDLIEIKVLTDARISPTGSHVAYTVHSVYKEATAVPRSSIWLVDTSGGNARQLTSGPRADRAPRWAPDSQTLAFLSDRKEDGRFLPYTLRMDGGEAQQLADLKGSVTNLQWSPDGGTVAFLMQDPEPDKDRGNDAREYERNPQYQRLWVVDASGGAPRLVSTGEVQVWEFAWFPDGLSFAIVCSDHPYEWGWYGSYLATLPIAGGEVLPIHKTEKQLAHPAPTADGAHVAFVSGTWSDRGVLGGNIYIVPATGGEARCVTAGYRASFSWMEWLDTARMLAIGYEDGEAAIFRVGADAAPERLWSAEAAFADRWWARASITGDGTLLALIMEDHNHPPDVWTVRIPRKGDRTEWTQLTRMQPHLSEFVRGNVETLRWNSSDGTPAQGLLFAPPGEPGKPYPLVTIVHGGPTSLFTHSYISSHYWAPLLVSNGYAAFLPNPRGSTGWGAEFSEANLGDMGGGDLRDILTGVDALVSSGVADAGRLALGGWSYGGYMTAWAVTQTDRFRAAIMGAGIANWLSFHGVCNIPAWDRLFWDADPYAIDSPFARCSPVYHVHNVRTPTLVLHGEDDAFVPVGQGYEWFRALREHGVETQLVTYPREGHGIVEKAHLEDMLRRSFEWFDSHLRDATP